MNVKYLMMSAFLTLSGAASAQTTEGGLSADMLHQIEQQQAPNATQRALFNAIAGNKIDDLVKNHAASAGFDTHFNVETPTQSIMNQQSSGRCWMFSGLNVLRADFAKNDRQGRTVEFSQAYLFFYDQLEKANLMLQGVIDCADKPMDDVRVQFFFHHPLSDGGTFCGVADLADKYGLVPKSVMPETFSSDNTSRMASLLSSKLREFGLELRRLSQHGATAQALHQRKTEQLGTIYHMLTLTLGRPVDHFTYQFCDKNGNLVGESKNYTPREFYRETVGRQLNGTFIMVMNDPRRDYHKTYEVEFDRHTYDGHNWKYLNLPMEEIARLAIASLKDGHKLYSSYDVGKQHDRKSGYCDTENYDYASLFDTTFPLSKADRIATFDSGSTHAMTLTAVDLDATGQPLKWKVENSWGTDYGCKGYLIMSNRWFNEYTFRLVVDKKYVPAALLKEFNSQPVLVMPEDPLFLEDN